ncbi:MAG: U32 family peptidase [Rhodocyclaceae bacterium]|nr:U32 family peptidase [Rhodocyclaceae bacterium]
MQDWADIAKTLAAAGKQAILGTQTLIESESDLKTLRRVIDEKDFLIEANDMGAVRLLSAEKRPFVAGPFLNIFNGATLAMMARLGAVRWVMPLEMSAAALSDLQAARPAGLETEVFAYGRMPAGLLGAASRRATSTCRRTTHSSVPAVSRRPPAHQDARRRGIPHAQRHPDAIVESLT